MSQTWVPPLKKCPNFGYVKHALDGVRAGYVCLKAKCADDACEEGSESVSKMGTSVHVPTLGRSSEMEPVVRTNRRSQ
jgi:hypothetical protein